MKKVLLCMMLLLLCLTALSAQAELPAQAEQLLDADGPVLSARVCSDAEMAGSQMALACQQKGAEYRLTLLTAQDGQWRVAACNEHFPIPLHGDDCVELSGNVLSANLYGMGGQDEYYFVMQPDAQGEWQITTFEIISAQAQNTASLMVLNDGAVLQMWTEGYYQSVFAENTGEYALDTRFSAFDPAKMADTVQRAARQLRNQPQAIPSTGQADALPQGKVMAFQKNKKLPVYAGPGKIYPQLGEGQNAVVSTNDWIMVYGRQGDYLLIQYNISDGRNRFGWISGDALNAPLSDVPELQFSAQAGYLDGFLTDDPLCSAAEADYLSVPCTVLATLGENIYYIEAQNTQGQTVRGFADAEAVQLYADYADSVLVTQANAVLYADAACTQPMASMRAGALGENMGQTGQAVQVRFGKDAAVLRGYMRMADVQLGSTAAEGAQLCAAVPVYGDADNVYIMGETLEGQLLLQQGYDEREAHYELADSKRYILLPDESSRGSFETVTIAADAPIYNRTDGRSPATLATLYAGVSLGVQRCGAFYYIQDFRFGFVQGFIPAEYIDQSSRSSAEGELCQAVLAPAGGQDCLYLNVSLAGSQDGLYARGTRLLLLGETDTQYLVATPALELDGLFDKQDVQPIEDRARYSQWDARAAYATLACNCDAYQAPDSQSAAYGSYAQGEQVLVLSRVDDWYCVVLGGFRVAYLPAQCLSDIPAQFAQ